jgi:hypothetical protein
LSGEFTRQPAVARPTALETTARKVLAGLDIVLPTPPAETTGHKILAGLDIALVDAGVVAKFIGDNFAGTPVAGIFKLLGPLAGIGAAVLHRHLTSVGFDLSTLQDAEIL